MNNRIPKAILVDVVPLETSKIEAYKRLEELESLVKTYGGIVVIKTIQKRGLPDYQTFIGKGKIEELIEDGKEKGGNIIILNNIVKPRQLFELGEIFRKEKIEVWDRIDLILRIFDKHAQSTEAKLQIELARIRHMGPRIFKMGGELMQQEGARGTRGGPGETNTEIMKRHLRKQEQNIMDKLRHYDLIKEGHRKRRKRQHFKTAALVGYTNAGKSSLLKALTGKDVYIADELFATLDTRIGNLYVEETHQQILVSDTIGFIQDLPPFLIQAFKSTLAEAIEADVLLHVIDISDPMYKKKIEVVEDILKQLELQDKQKIYVFNKMDLVNLEEVEIPEKNKENKENEIEEPPKPRTTGVLRAGRETAELLGWLDKDRDLELMKNPKLTIHNLKHNYKEFNPVFVSAEKKTQLNLLIKKISDITHSTEP
ncbi:MAG: GTPase HflX [Candidatus Gracilibacteria bacterium]